HQLAPAALAHGRSQALGSVHDPGDEAVIVEAKPASTRLLVKPGDNPGPVGPMASRRQPGPPAHLVAIGAEDDRPVMAREEEDDATAHEMPIGMEMGVGVRRVDGFKTRGNSLYTEPSILTTQGVQGDDGVQRSREGFRGEIRA